MSKEMNYLYIPACPDAIAQAWHLSTRSLFFPMYFQLQQRGYNYSDRVISTMTVSVLTFWVIKPKTPNTNCFRDNLKSIKFGRCRWNSKKLRKNKKQTKKKEQQKYTELDHTAVCCGWEKKKKSDVSKERRMAGDTWSKSRSEDPEAVADTQTHNNHVTAALYTEIHTAVRGRRRSFTKHHHHPFPRVSLTPFLPHTHTHTLFSLSHTHIHTNTVARRQHAVHEACGESLLSRAD